MSGSYNEFALGQRRFSVHHQLIVNPIMSARRVTLASFRRTNSFMFQDGMNFGKEGSLESFSEDSNDSIKTNMAAREAKMKQLTKNKLRSSSVIMWLKKRCQNKAKTQTMLTQNEIDRNKDIIQIFKHFDENQSGQLELKEIVQMLEQNGMRMSKEHTREFFEVLDADKSGGLSMAEFKDFLFSEECRDGFRNLMRRVRLDQHKRLLDSKNEEELMNCSFGQYLPFTFEEMLQYMHKLSKRNAILAKIKAPSQIKGKEETKQHIVNYVKLFKSYRQIIDDSANQPPTFLRLAKEEAKRKAEPQSKKSSNYASLRTRGYEFRSDLEEVSSASSRGVKITEEDYDSVRDSATGSSDTGSRTFRRSQKRVAWQGQRLQSLNQTARLL